MLMNMLFMLINHQLANSIIVHGLLSTERPQWKMLYVPSQELSRGNEALTVNGTSRAKYCK